MRLPNGKTYAQDGSLDYIDPTVASNTDTLTFRARIPNPLRPGAKAADPGSRELSDGEFVTVSLQGVEPIQALAIARAAILSDQQGNYVWVVGDGNKVEQRRVQLGQSTPETAVIASGLKEGETVVVDGVQRVRPGAVVAPAPAPGPAIHAGPGAETVVAPGTHTMISSVFVDRPRLAVVIAIVITIAGALSMLRIPVAQFPDIVPPQVQVTTRYPGASAAVVEATVAQPLEAQVNGADQMLYNEVELRERRQLRPHRLLRARHQPRHQHRQRQQPRPGRPSPACPSRCSARASPSPSARRPSSSSSPSTARAPNRTRCSSRTTSPSTSSTG